MTIKASAVTPAKAIELAPGALFTIETNWYLRALLKGQQEQDIESAIPLSEGAEFIHVGAERCIALAPFHSYECRLIGEIQGPGRPFPARSHGPLAASRCWLGINFSRRSTAVSPRTSTSVRLSMSRIGACG